MLRIWLCILALLFTSLGGSGSLPTGATGEVCTQRCQDDDPRGQCAPDCADCLCCTHVRPVMLARAAALLPFLRDTGGCIEHEEQVPPSVDAGDLLRPPIAARA